MPVDSLDGAALKTALVGAEAVICTIGFPYSAALWERAWPQTMTNLLAACEAAGARLVFADNLYLYGPQDLPLTEDLPPVDHGRKPRARTEVTRLWQQAHGQGRVQAVAVRSPDFYGPGVEQSVLGAASVMSMARGKRPIVMGGADLPHDVTHVSDCARALLTLLDAGEGDYGQAWHVPCDETMTLRQHLSIAASALGIPLRLIVVPRWAAPALGVVMPIVREGIEMQFMFDRPYIVDSSKFRRRFWSDVVSLARGLTETALSFRPPSTIVGGVVDTAAVRHQ
jgi:nucleoside-diphosphate-sugar epimerase